MIIGALFLILCGLLPAALIVMVLNLVLPEDLADEAAEETSGGMAGCVLDSLPGRLGSRLSPPHHRCGR